MGREAAEVRGVIEDTTKAAHRSAEAVSALARQVEQITQSQQGIVSMTQGSHAAVARARDAVEGVGAVLSAMLDVPASTLSFHLKELIHAQLVTVERDGRSLIVASLDHNQLAELYTVRTELEGLVDRLGPLSMPSEGDPERFSRAMNK